jgi:branched-chain amino acid transport system substrate-binding protein
VPHRIRFAILLAATAILAGCGLEAPSSQSQAIRFGTVLSLTGSQAADGRATREGYLFCQHWLNSQGGIAVAGVRHPLELRMLDDAGRLSRSVALTYQLLEGDHVRLLLGPSSDAATLREGLVADEHGVPMVHSAGVSDNLFDRHLHGVFGVLSPADQHMRSVIDMALAHSDRPKTVAILHANDSLSSEVAERTRDYATARGLSTVALVAYPTEVNDLRGTLATAAAMQPDLILEVGHPGEAALTMRTAREMNLRPRLFGFSADPGIEGLVTSRQTAEGIVAETQWSPNARTRPGPFLNSHDYAAQFTSQFGHPPNAGSAAATAACFALTTAIQGAGSTNPAPVRAALTNLRLDTFFGPIRFDARGANVAKPNTVVQVQDGKPAVVWPAEVATVFPRYPWGGWR